MSERTYYSEESKNRAQLRIAALVSICLALGAGIGTILAILFAPKSGEEIREDIADVFSNQIEQGRKATENAIERLEGRVDELRDRVETNAS